MEIIKLGDFAFFYHISKEKVIFGVAEVFKKYHHVNGFKFGLVGVRFSKPLLNQVTLSDIKRSLLLENFSHFKTSTLINFSSFRIKWNEIVKISDV
ncbi:EVE domain-containing protein [Wolbachia endosymbiont of Litomosoides sigmodontis]|uniref:EVE domain-containing protein n=1 Tax=Wolbachia endosymbiont of Litomosoides sigmodontis TaxID=80850 RepID=UPI00158E7C5C|nr:EVE domain-containing protein [Wolbachia endosymbiont of Litomosoides sigmodontis]QKX03259.1 EVE domain-containing protein [Wolbachia endosymbiont of Litomosoides sigmodontis]